MPNHHPLDQTGFDWKNAKKVVTGFECDPKKPRTGCVCKNPGMCERHGIVKHQRLWELCACDWDYFLAWERREGILQNVEWMKEKTRRLKEKHAKELPSLKEQTISLSISGIDFIKDRCRLTSKEHAQARFDICLKCDYYFPPKKDPQSNWGKCSKCGCYSKVKSKGRAWTCRLGYWLEIDLEFNNREEMSS